MSTFWLQTVSIYSQISIAYVSTLLTLNKASQVPEKSEIVANRGYNIRKMARAQLNLIQRPNLMNVCLRILTLRAKEPVTDPIEPLEPIQPTAAPTLTATQPTEPTITPLDIVGAKVLGVTCTIASASVINPSSTCITTNSNQETILTVEPVETLTSPSHSETVVAELTTPQPTVIEAQEQVVPVPPPRPKYVAPEPKKKKIAGKKTGFRPR